MNLELFTENSLLVFSKSGRLLVELSPYVLGGVLIGEALRYASWLKIVNNVCNANPLLAVFMAAVLGTVSPLCTYGTVPIVLYLFRTGTPLPPIVTFLSTSSLMNPQLFILTWGGIDAEMALVRLVAVLIYGFLLGVVLLKFFSKTIVNPKVYSSRIDKKHQTDSISKRFSKKEFLDHSWHSIQFVGYYLIIGIILGSIIEVFVPGRWLYVLFSPDGWFAVPLAAILGIPLYACGGGTIPLIRTMLFTGMAKGAALAFFMVGPATRITPLLAITTVIRPRFITVYVFSLIVFSLIAGFIYG